MHENDDWHVMQWKRVIFIASCALKSERGSVVYVDGGLKRTTWVAQWLEHRLISEGRGFKLLVWDFSLRYWFEQDHLVAKGGS